MTYYAKKMRVYNLLSLICVLLANLFFIFAFCVLFCGQDFSLSYYQWLKTIDVCLAVVPITLLIGINTYLIVNIEKNAKQNKFVNVIFNILEIIVLCVVIINIISFYYGAVYILLLLGVGVYLLSQVIMLCSYFFVDEVDRVTSPVQAAKQIKVYDGTNVVSRNADELTMDTRLDKRVFVILLIFNIIINVVALVLYFGIVDIALIGNEWYTCLAIFLSVISFVNIACSGICIVFYKATLLRDLSIRILYILISICNILLLPVFSVASYLSSNAGLDFVGLIIVFVSTLVVNYYIGKYIYELKHIYKKITHKD